MKEILCLIHAILVRLDPVGHSEFVHQKLGELGEKIEGFSEDSLSESEKEFIRSLHEFCMDIKREARNERLR